MSADRHPALVADVEFIGQAAPGRPDRHVARHKPTGQVMEMTDKEVFLCRQLDGRTDAETIRTRFEAQFRLRLDAAHLAAFLRQLAGRGLLAGGGVDPGLTDRWAQMRAVPIRADVFFARLHFLAGWWFSWPGRILAGVLVVVGVLLAFAEGPLVVHAVAHLPTTIERAARDPHQSSQMVFRLVLLLLVIPLLRELAKGVRCHREGCRVPELRYDFFLRFLPRVAADLSGITRFEKAPRLWIMAAGLELELVLFGTGALFAAMLRRDNPLQEDALSLAIAAGLSFLFNLLPLGQQDGSRLLSIAREIPEYRERSVQASRAWWMRGVPPEALGGDQRARFIRYGLACEIYGGALNIAVFWLLGYLLVTWLEGYGAVLLAVLLFLRFEDEVRAALRALNPLR